ncbi:carbohydrate ABC transporter permease [Sinorhizobium meliloti]|uniref:carbohydrate ABC transporter permease n=1 Tax=Sinorhizobium TaxID=28105 RepID=UPI0023D8B16E|nr:MULTISPECIES: sugar ABC transporter permease [unclassified Sinorhizobium]WEJ13621.1 sugar ABC transporter permease [Sinorhizobium sp. M103]WEJ18719.1 sugar ABC transporter permease [Sinorhizobium sp. K101]WEJ39349.1 sugar ABC transporter permease [Sinorhizobium sp. C101]
MTRWLLPGFLGVGVLATLLLIVGPALYAVSLSFYDMPSLTADPVWVGLSKYSEVLASAEFWNALWNGIVYAGLAIVLQVVLGIGFALLLNQNFIGRSLLRGLAFLPYLLPTVVAVLVFKWMVDGSLGIVTILMDDWGLPPIYWFETETASMVSVILISVWLWTPFVTTTFLAGLQTVPSQLYEAARVDGAGPIRRFLHVTLPSLRPILTVIILLRGVWMFNKFDVVWLTTGGGPLGGTEHLPVLSYREAFALYDIGSGAAIATLSFLVLMVAVAIYFRVFPMEEGK